MHELATNAAKYCALSVPSGRIEIEWSKTKNEGQLNLSCAQCHDDNWGKRLAGSVIPQAHPNGYPIYRLEWQSVGSLQRRLRNCIFGMRAEPFAFGAPSSRATITITPTR